MKSIMQEASSIFKAVEKAWERAEKPNSFSIKVLEEPVKNFFGMTVKSAKIALYFDEAPVVSKPVKHQSAQQPVQQQRKPQQAPVAQQPREQKKPVHQPKPTPVQPAPAAQQRPQKQTSESATPAPVNNAVWNDAMSSAAQQWVQGVISSMGKDIRYTLSSSAYQLTITFDKPLVDTGKDKLFFGSLAYLLMQSIRHQFKSEARGLKVLLTVA